MKELTLPIELANQIMAYLGTRPYQEVVGLIMALQQEAQKQAPANQEQPE